MPMAMIAVALLVTGSFFCVINKSIESSTDNSESLEMEFASIDEVSDSAVLGIETALGNIITDISTSCTGNLFERSEIFKRRVASMFSSEYPSFERGVRTEILSHDISLKLESLRVGTGFDVPGSSASTSVLTVRSRSRSHRRPEAAPGPWRYLRTPHPASPSSWRMPAGSSSRPTVTHPHSHR